MTLQYNIPVVVDNYDDVTQGVCPECGKQYDSLDFSYSDPSRCNDGTIIAEAVCPECWVGLVSKQDEP
jgi:hypothetical protein